MSTAGFKRAHLKRAECSDALHGTSTTCHRTGRWPRLLVDTHGGAPISALPPPKKSYFRLLPIHDKRFKCNIMVKAFPGKIERVPLEPHMLFWAVF